MQDNDDIRKIIDDFPENEKQKAEEKLEKKKVQWREEWPSVISKSALQLIVEIINTNAFCSISKDAEIVQKLRDELVSANFLTTSTLQLINTNTFCSISKDAEIVQKLRDELVSANLLTRTDTPYVGCCEVAKKD